MRVLLTQPYMPAYRVPLFQAIHDKLAAIGDELVVAVGQPSGSQLQRGDAASSPWSKTYKSRTIAIAGRTVSLRSMGEPLNNFDVIVSELEALNTFAWRASLTKIPLVLWGHGKSYVDAPSALGDRIEWALAKRATSIMTYSASGRDYLTEVGHVDPSRVTAIGNSTDTATLRAATRGALDLPSSRTDSDVQSGSPIQALYVGGLDPAKRIDFLLDAAKHAHALNQNFRLVIVGRGVLEEEVDRIAATHSFIRRVQSARGPELAALGAESHAIWMPGRVGLVAVDALAMGLSVHTTTYDFHAPEIEFLGSEEVAFLDDRPSAFAHESLSLMESARRGPERFREDIPSIEKVASAFVDVIGAAKSGRRPCLST